MTYKHFTARPLIHMNEFSQVVDLQREICRTGSKNIVAEKVFQVLAGEGSATIGLFDDSDRLCGFLMHFPCIEDGKAYTREFRLVIEPSVREYGVVQLLRQTLKKIASTAGIERIRFDVPVLPFENVHEAVSLQGSRGNKCINRNSHSSVNCQQLLVDWELHGCSGTTDHQSTTPIIEIDVIDGFPQPGKTYTDLSKSFLGLPVPLEKIWNQLSGQLRVVWYEKVCEILNCYFKKGYALTGTIPENDSDMCARYVLTNSLI